MLPSLSCPSCAVIGASQHSKALMPDVAMPCLQSYGLIHISSAADKVMIMELLDGTLDDVPRDANG